MRVIANGRPEDRGTLETFIADRQLQQDPDLSRFFERYCGDTCLNADPTAFVAELHQRWQARNPPGEIADVAAHSKPNMAPGAVFLSFSSVDRELVRSLKERLDRARLDVWFDERDLKQE